MNKKKIVHIAMNHPKWRVRKKNINRMKKSIKTIKDSEEFIELITKQIQYIFARTRFISVEECLYKQRQDAPDCIEFVCSFNNKKENENG